MAVKKSFRVKSNVDFDAIFRAHKSFANRAFIVYQLDQKKPHFRVGISISKKLGNAVTRNHIKRLIRHVIREFSPELSDVDFVIIARKGVETYSFHEIKKNLLHLLKGAKIYQS